MTEVRATSESGGQKGRKPERFSLIPPDVMEELARLYGKGAEKYEDRNWEKGYPFSWSYDAVQRHLHQWWKGEDVDEETETSHLVNAMWHLIGLRWFELHRKGQDDRPWLSS